MLNTNKKTLVAMIALIVSNITFADTIQLPTTSKGNFNLTTADFNNDGHPDILYTSTYTTELNILTGVGDGSFNNNVIAADYRSFNVEAVDLNKDGLLDIVTTNSSYNNVCVFWNAGSLKFVKANYSVDQMPSRMQVADLNSDGYPEIITVNAISRTVSILKNTSTATAKRFANAVSVASQLNDVIVSDYNKDGKLDLVGVSGSTMTVLTNTGNLTFTKSTVPLLSKPAIRVSAFGDNYAVLFTDANVKLSKINVIQPDGVVVDNLGVSYMTNNMDIKDMNSDGLLDIVTTNGNLTIDVMENSDSGFLPTANYLTDGIRTPTDSILVDTDHNGLYEVATVSSTESVLSIVEPVFTTAKAHDDNGHGNDVGGYDYSNPGNKSAPVGVNNGKSVSTTTGKAIGKQ